MGKPEPKPKLEKHTSNRTRLGAGEWVAIWAGGSAATMASGLKAVVAIPGACVGCLIVWGIMRFWQPRQPMRRDSDPGQRLPPDEAPR